MESIESAQEHFTSRRPCAYDERMAAAARAMKWKVAAPAWSCTTSGPLHVHTPPTLAQWMARESMQTEGKPPSDGHGPFGWSVA